LKVERECAVGHIPFVIYRHAPRGQLGVPLSSPNVTVLPPLEIWRATNISPRPVFAFAPTTWTLIALL
jgi:hypothetical protein